MNANQADLANNLINFISQQIISGREDLQLQADDNLLEDMLVDSLGIIRLVTFIEERYRFSIPPEDVTIENFMTVNTIVAYLLPNLNNDAD